MSIPKATIDIDSWMFQLVRTNDIIVCESAMPTNELLSTI